MRNKLIKGLIALVVIAVTVTVIFTTTTSSTNEPRIEKLNTNELKEWSNRNDTILRNDKPVAIFEHYEYEVNPNHRRPNIHAELCFIQVDNDPDNTFAMIRYIYTLHPSSKIQVEFKDQYDRIDLWKSKMN